MVFRAKQQSDKKYRTGNPPPPLRTRALRVYTYRDIGSQLVDEFGGGLPLEQRVVRRTLEYVTGQQEQRGHAPVVGLAFLVTYKLRHPREAAVTPTTSRVVFVAPVAVHVRLVEMAVRVVGVQQHQFQLAGRD